MFDISIANKKRKPVGNKFLASLNRKKRLEEGVELVFMDNRPLNGPKFGMWTSYINSFNEGSRVRESKYHKK